MRRATFGEQPPKMLAESEKVPVMPATFAELAKCVTESMEDTKETEKPL
jgi:hypothetical protein